MRSTASAANGDRAWRAGRRTRPPHWHRIAHALGQPVVIENRPGAGSIVGTKAAAGAPPDG